MQCVECRRAFPTVSGVPVLVDFDHSILDESSVQHTAAASPVERRSRGRFSRYFDGDNPVAAEHATAIESALRRGARILVVGGASIGKGMDALYSGRFEVVGFDIYASEHTQLIADAHRIPFADETFDAVIVQAVLEHVLDPRGVVEEIWRVLNASGLVYSETPFLQQVHEGPYDFSRFTESGHRWLFRDFELISSGVVAGPGNELLWSIDYAVRGLFGSRRAGLRARKLATPLRALDRWVDPRHAVDAASAVFFYGRRSDTAITPQQIVAHYQGAQ